MTTIDPRFGSYYFDIVMWGGDQWTLTTWSVQHPIYHNVTRIDNRLSIFTVKTKYLWKNATLRTVQQDFVLFREDVLMPQYAWGEHIGNHSGYMK